MRYIDLNINADTPQAIQSLSSMGGALGYSGLAAKGQSYHEAPVQIELFSRADLTAKRLAGLKKEVSRTRKRHLVLATPLGGVDTTNWAAEEGTIDLLTLPLTGNGRLRTSTARLAAGSNTALEIVIHPLLITKGLERSRVLKTMTDAIKIAVQGEMKVVLTSGALQPIHMRSPYAMIHIGMLLGLERLESIESISQTPHEIIERNIKRLDDNYILPGLEVVGDRR